MATTVKPSGLTITRNNMAFSFEWKIADKDYGAGQELQYQTNLMKNWESVSIGKTTTKKSVSLTAADYNPTKSKELESISFRVRGRRKKYTEGSGDKQKTYEPDWSAWATKKISLLAPLAPKITATLSSTNSNQTVFEWELDNDPKSNRPFVHIEWQTRRVKSSNITDGSQIAWVSKRSAEYGWDTGTTGASGSKTITEDSALLAQSSYTRWVRVRARGAGGDSAWRYAKHVYSQPNKANIKETTSTVSGGATTIVTEWTAGSNASHPIDSTTVEYLIATPAANLAVPSGASWTESNVSKDTKGADAAKITIDTTVGIDQCLWVRVKTQHDTNVKYSAADLVRCGKLTAPSNLSVSVNESTHRATITATNNSAVPDSQLAVIFRATGWKTRILGVIPHGSTSVTVQCPSWKAGADVSFGVYAFQGTYTTTYDEDAGTTTYAIEENMASAKVYDGGTVPSAPTSLTAEISDTPGEVILTWDWSWAEADSAEISWSQNPNAWESTDEPNVYAISNLNTAKWRVSSLETGKTWYFRVRLAKYSAEEMTYGPYSDIVSVDLSSAPNIPVLNLSTAVITAEGTVAASWAYVSTDNTPQAYAEICQVTQNGDTITYGEILAHATNEQRVLISAADAGWTTGETYLLCLKVTSESGRESAWSDPVAIEIAEPMTCEITQTSLVTQSITRDYNPATTYTVTQGSAILSINAEAFGAAVGYTAGNYAFEVVDGTWAYNGSEIDPGAYGISPTVDDASITITLTVDPVTDTEQTLTAMPLTVTVEGADAGGTTTVIIERAEDYHMERPDGEPMDGYDGETIAVYRQTGEAQIEIDDLIGSLDDGAAYRLLAVTEDGLGQAASASIEFTVRWAHQAGIPGGSEVADGLVALITPTAPAEYASGDYCDIYRLSADKPELIVRNGEFNRVYVDPYPAIGEGCGHRIVHRTSNGDYITAANHPAWTDLINEVVIDEQSVIIDFDGRQAILPYNISLSDRWNKDFQVTSYLGGSKQGDWNPGISRTGSFTTVLMPDDDMLPIIRSLAAHNGICHVRTPDGSSFAANVDVSESKSHMSSNKVSYTLTVTRIDPEELDGQTYEEWIG